MKSDGQSTRATTVGITGHRAIPPAACRHVHAGLVTALRAAGHPNGADRRPLEVLSSLAIGADQLFAEVALAHGARLTAVLPSSDYEQTFDAGELVLFRRLLDRADRQVVMGHAKVCDEAYYEAGTYIADHSDLVLAVWDGRPARGHGGTGEIVDYARRRGTPVSVIWKAGVVRDPA
ncbi:hypothetical protein POF50_000530 [Streptomyces sp. SL13]|uniref:DUF1273 family protein n=1 Tax=Streptantibioticus silvisoli TaxID=2705255 RepID=A0AA90GWR3_9ACTN|nr:hypothetical protein [Streptantibioticus silvisoli]MDI5967851.1 hypothetical protein [Streptantibioticus silvisoli]